MWRTARGARVAAVAFALGASGCGSAHTASLDQAAKAGLPAYYVGTSFQGEALSYVSVESSRQVRLGYGKPRCYSDYCDYPLMITTDRISKNVPELPTSVFGQHDCFRGSVRGVPVVRSPNEPTGPLIFTGQVRVSISTTPDRVRAVAEALRRIGDKRGGYRLPKPPTWITRGWSVIRGTETGCEPDATVLAPLSPTLHTLRKHVPGALFLGLSYQGRWLDRAHQGPWGLEFDYVACGTVGGPARSRRGGCDESTVIDAPIATALHEIATAHSCRMGTLAGVPTFTLTFTNPGGSLPISQTLLLSGRFAVTTSDAEMSDLRPLSAPTRSSVYAPPPASVVMHARTACRRVGDR
jgi:hypothetical protein